MIKNILLNNKKELKYKEYDIRGEKIKLLGLGNKAIKYCNIDNEDVDIFAYYDKWEGRIIAKELIKSFDNELWNDKIRANIEAQKKYCATHKAPHFAPQDGFCSSCGKQIHTRISLDKASSELITGCPHCSRSYCD